MERKTSTDVSKSLSLISKIVRIYIEKMKAKKAVKHRNIFREIFNSEKIMFIN